MTVSPCSHQTGGRPTDCISERVLGQLFDEYGLSKLENHLENLNRFLAFIGELSPCLTMIKG